jgi:5-methylcytosine-specific restriction enzyme subunit McrC
MIPIQNLYYIFCYAWRKLEQGNVIDVGEVFSPELADLFAKVLLGGVRHIIRRGMDRGYVSSEETVDILRGRIRIYDTLRFVARHSNQLVCEFDDLSHNIPTNQVLKSTIRRLINTTGIDADNAHQLRLLLKSFDLVSEPRLSRQIFRQIRIHRNNQFYDFLISICELIYDATFPEPDGKTYRFSDVLRDEKKMPLVFQDFIRNFYSIEQNDYEVTPLQMRWDATSESDDELRLLPTMTTDIHLKNDKCRIIIDTKYYKEALQEHYGKRSINSGNLYQLFSYLKNSEALSPAYANSEGILLYPAVGEKIDFRASFQGHPIRIVTVNLDQPWEKIRTDLLSVLMQPTNP